MVCDRPAIVHEHQEGLKDIAKLVLHVALQVEPGVGRERGRDVRGHEDGETTRIARRHGSGDALRHPEVQRALRGEHHGEERDQPDADPPVEAPVPAGITPRQAHGDPERSRGACPERSRGVRHPQPCTRPPTRSARLRGPPGSASIFFLMRLTSVSTLRTVTNVSSFHTLLRSASRLNTMPGFDRSTRSSSNSLNVRSTSRRADANAAPRRVDFDVLVHQRPRMVAVARLRRERHTATQQRAHARHQLAHAERLGQVIVRPAVQAQHLVGLVTPRRQHQDRRIRVRRVAADRAAQRDAVNARAA